MTFQKTQVNHWIWKFFWGGIPQFFLRHPHIYSQVIDTLISRSGRSLIKQRFLYETWVSVTTLQPKQFYVHLPQTTQTNVVWKKTISMTWAFSPNTFQFREVPITVTKNNLKKNGGIFPHPVLTGKGKRQLSAQVSTNDALQAFRWVLGAAVTEAKKWDCCGKGTV